MLCQLDPQQVTAALHSTVRAAHRRKSLRSDALPFAVVSLDGKSTAISSCDDGIAQRQTGEDPSALVGAVRTITSTLISNSAKPCIDVFPVPARTNEMGAFSAALDQLMTTYPALDIRLVSYDAGAVSLANASAVVERHLHYLFCLRATQPTLHDAARSWLGTRADTSCDFRDERREGGCTVTRLLFIGRAQEGPEGWEHLRTILRVKTITVRSNGCTTTDERYLMSSLASDRLSPRQWQTIIRLRWGVETCHQILDTALSEDDHPWITGHPRGMLVVAILRRIVFTLLAIYRAITQRSDERRQMPWKLLLEEIWTVLITASPEALLGLRHRPLAPSG
ncbi:MAG: transposase [Polyangiaceae bacterium]|nr:transposase [Polyangiaceae bacterium]